MDLSVRRLIAVLFLLSSLISSAALAEIIGTYKGKIVSPSSHGNCTPSQNYFPFIIDSLPYEVEVSSTAIGGILLWFTAAENGNVPLASRVLHDWLVSLEPVFFGAQYIGGELIGTPRPWGRSLVKFSVRSEKPRDRLYVNFEIRSYSSTFSAPHCVYTGMFIGKPLIP